MRLLLSMMGPKIRLAKLPCKKERKNPLIYMLLNTLRIEEKEGPFELEWLAQSENKY